MKVRVNGREINIFSGAKVRDALRKASAKVLAEVEAGTKKVMDRWGNERDLDGALTAGEELKVV